MTHYEFIERLKSIPLEATEYQKCGYDDDFIGEIIRRYTIVKKKKKTNKAVDQNDPIISLISEFDVTKLEIGMVNFYEEIKVVDDYLIFGKADVDDLAIYNVTNEIILLDDTTYELVNYVTSKSSKFLEALLLIGSFFQKRSIDDTLFDNEKANLLIAEEIAEIAGGQKYLTFYRMMLGV